MTTPSLLSERRPTNRFSTRGKSDPGLTAHACGSVDDNKAGPVVAVTQPADVANVGGPTSGFGGDSARDVELPMPNPAPAMAAPPTRLMARKPAMRLTYRLYAVRSRTG